MKVIIIYSYETVLQIYNTILSMVHYFTIFNNNSSENIRHRSVSKYGMEYCWNKMKNHDVNREY